MIHGATPDLTKLLRVQPAPAGGWLGGHVSDARSRVYGGQFLGQGLMAALADDGAASAQSLHALYIRAGSTDTPLTYRRPGHPDVQAGSYIPHVDVREEGDTYIVEAEVPAGAVTGLQFSPDSDLLAILEEQLVNDSGGLARAKQLPSYALLPSS